MEGLLLSGADHDLSRVATSFDETDLVPNAGLLPAAVLASIAARTRLSCRAVMEKRTSKF